MVLSLATRSPVRATKASVHGAFATLIGPVGAARRDGDNNPNRPPSREKHLLATVAHELRNPLASLCLSLDMLVSDFDDLQPEAALRLVRRAQPRPSPPRP